MHSRRHIELIGCRELFLKQNLSSMVPLWTRFVCERISVLHRFSCRAQADMVFRSMMYLRRNDDEPAVQGDGPLVTVKLTFPLMRLISSCMMSTGTTGKFTVGTVKLTSGSVRQDVCT